MPSSALKTKKAYIDQREQIRLFLERVFLFGVVAAVAQIALFFFFNVTATTEIYTLSLHDALPISGVRRSVCVREPLPPVVEGDGSGPRGRSEEHTSELQSLRHLVCRLLLEKKKRNLNNTYSRKRRNRSDN